MAEAVSIAKPHEDRVLPAVVYGLYLFSLPSALIALFIGLVVAYANRATAGPRMATHYEFLIQTFWKSLWWFLIAGALCVVGGVFSVVLIGLPVLLVGILIFCAVGFWFFARCVIGLIYLAQDEAYPRPDAWLF